jgi:hypothetical protein
MTDLEKPVGKAKNAKKLKKLRKNSRKAVISQRKFEGINNERLYATMDFPPRKKPRVKSPELHAHSGLDFCTF